MRLIYVQVHKYTLFFFAFSLLSFTEKCSTQKEKRIGYTTIAIGRFAQILAFKITRFPRKCGICRDKSQSKKKKQKYKKENTVNFFRLVLFVAANKFGPVTSEYTLQDIDLGSEEEKQNRNE